MYRKIIIVCLIGIALCVPPVCAIDSTGYFQRYSSGYFVSWNNYWDTVHDATSATLYPSPTYAMEGCQVQTTTTTNKYAIKRQYMIFNTSMVPDDKEVKYALVRFTVGHTWDYFESNFSIVVFNPSSPTAIVSGDYDQYGTNKLTDTDIDTIADEWTITLNITDGSVISKTGYTCLGMRVSEDIDDEKPTWVSSKISGVRPYDNAPYTPVSMNVYYGDYDVPEVILTSDKTSGAVPLTVTFTDESIRFSEAEPYPTFVFMPGDGAYYSGNRVSTGQSWIHTYNTAGNYTANLSITEGGTTYYDTINITVGANTGNLNIKVAGSDGNPISGASVSAFYDGSLQDTDTSDINGDTYFDVPSNRMVNGTVNLTGYYDASYSQYVSTWDTWKVVTLYHTYETPPTTSEYYSYIIHFRNANTHAAMSNVFFDVYYDSNHELPYTSEHAVTGIWTGLLPNGTTFYFESKAANFINYTWSDALNGGSKEVTIDMIPVDYSTLNPVLNIWVYTTAGIPISSAVVRVNSDTDDGYHTTNTSGYARHFCDPIPHGSNREYSIEVTKPGYNTEVGYIDVSTQQPVIFVYMESSTVATVTPTSVYTPVETPIWSGDGGTPGNIKEQLINTLMTQFGVSQLEANILMGIILTILCAVVVGGGLASYGSGSGAGVGAMIGAVVGFSGSSIIGFFPIWILIVVIVLVFAAWFMFRGRDE